MADGKCLDLRVVEGKRSGIEKTKHMKPTREMSASPRTSDRSVCEGAARAVVASCRGSSSSRALVDGSSVPHLRCICNRHPCCRAERSSVFSSYIALNARRVVCRVYSFRPTRVCLPEETRTERRRKERRIGSSAKGW
jgi:hypothetical protein